jgi:cation diffusion facilitator family transporter
MSGRDCRPPADGSAQRGVLIALLLINAGAFVGELIAGILADSTGLIADSLDMLADATVYAIALYAVGKSSLTKIKAARWSGVFQAALAVCVILDVARRFIFGSEPQSTLIMVIGAAALVANVVCLRLLSAHRRGEVHMRASWIFSRNDVIANLGVIAGGFLVSVTHSRWPDLIIGVAIACLVFRGGLHILRDAAAEALSGKDHLPQ